MDQKLSIIKIMDTGKMLSLLNDYRLAENTKRLCISKKQTSLILNTLKDTNSALQQENS